VDGGVVGGCEGGAWGGGVGGADGGGVRGGVETSGAAMEGVMVVEWDPHVCISAAVRDVPPLIHRIVAWGSWGMWAGGSLGNREGKRMPAARIVARAGMVAVGRVARTDKVVYR